MPRFLSKLTKALDLNWKTSRRSARGRRLSCFEVERLDERVLLSVAAINYPMSSGPVHENTFMTCQGKLHLDYWDGASWRGVDLQNGGSAIASDPAVSNYQVGSVLHENVYVRGGDGNLYTDTWDPAKWIWTWAPLGNGGSRLCGNPAVIDYQIGGVTHENVYVTGCDGNMYTDYYDGNGWTWVNLHNGGSSLTSSPAVINYQIGGATHENVYATGSDGNLYTDSFDPNTWIWTWANLGNGGSRISSSPAVINYWVGTVQHENVYVAGSDGNLYTDYFDGNGWNWANLGNGGASVVGSPSTVNCTVNGVAREYVFVRGSNGQLYDAFYVPGSGWSWENHGYPLNGVGVIGEPGADVYAGNNKLSAFVQGGDGELYDAFYLPSSGWNWETHGVLHPLAPGAPAYSPVSGTLFGPNGPSYLDVQQGHPEGDCWLMASLAEVAARQPGTIQNMFTYAGNILENGSLVSVYQVLFYDSVGGAHYVTVDNELPGGGTYYDRPVGGVGAVNGSASPVLWAALAEKGYAEANGFGYVQAWPANSDSYDALGNTPNNPSTGGSGGVAAWAIRGITGKSSSEYNLDLSTDPASVVSAWKNPGELVLLATSAPNKAVVNPYLYGTHVYALVNYDPSRSYPFQIFNPYGRDPNDGWEPGTNSTKYGRVWVNAAFLSQNFWHQVIGGGGSLPDQASESSLGAGAPPPDHSLESFGVGTALQEHSSEPFWGSAAPREHSSESFGASAVPRSNSSESFGGAATSRGLEGHHAWSSQEPADLLLIEDPLEAHAKTRSGGGDMDFLPDLASL